jgi:GNAT superfamily N-acetyltransferase
MTIGFVHACEQNQLNLSTVGGGSVAQLTSGKVVTSPVDPFWVYNYAFGLRRPVAMGELTAAFRGAGRDYLHVMASPSSRAALPAELAGLGFHLEWSDAVWRAAGTGAGAPGLVELGPDDLDSYLAIWKSAWGAAHHATEEAFGLRLRDARTRPFRTAEATGVFMLFASGPTTQLIHFAVAAGAQGRGVGRRMLELARGLVATGRPLWLATDVDGPGVRAAAAAGWTAAHRAGHWLLDLEGPPERPDDGARATKGSS